MFCFVGCACFVLERVKFPACTAPPFMVLVLSARLLLPLLLTCLTAGLLFVRGGKRRDGLFRFFILFLFASRTGTGDSSTAHVSIHSFSSPPCFSNISLVLRLGSVLVFDPWIHFSYFLCSSPSSSCVVSFDVPDSLCSAFFFRLPCKQESGESG